MTFVSIEDRGPAISRAAVRRDHIAGGVFMLAGGLIALGALAHPLGTAMRMGPGYFPLLLGVALFALGLAIAAGAERSDVLVRNAFPNAPWLRPLALVPLSVVLFALVVGPGGLIAAVTGVVVISGLAHPASRWRSMLLLAALLAFGSVGVFAYGLRLPFQTLPI